MNASGSRPYCRRAMDCAAGTRGRCRVCHGNEVRAAAMAAQYTKGKSIKAIASYFGVSPQRARIVLKNAGVLRQKPSSRSRKDLTSDQYRRFRTMCSKGLPAAYAHEEVRRA